MTFLQILKQSPLPPKETELLVSFLLNKSREYILTHPEIDLPPTTYKKFLNLEKKRLANWSIAVIIGEKEFYGLNFKVDKNVLVPRPETEILVDEVLNIIKSQNNNSLIIDLGTGSGAIITALAKNLKLSAAKYMAVDISAQALKIAKQNARIYKLDNIIKFYQGNLLTPIIKYLDGQDLIIAANLPYLTKAQIKNSPSIQYEPELALDGGKDGLKYYKILFKQLKRVNYNSLSLIIEIDPAQTTLLKALIKVNFPLVNIQTLKDYSGQNRFILLKHFVFSSK